MQPPNKLFVELASEIYNKEQIRYNSLLKAGITANNVINMKKAII